MQMEYMIKFLKQFVSIKTIPKCFMHHGVVITTYAKLYSTKPRHVFCAGLNSAC